MNQFTDITCDSCFGIFPGNTMTKVSDEILVGRTVTPVQEWKEDFDGTFHIKKISQVSSQHGLKDSIICPKCAVKRIAEIKEIDDERKKILSKMKRQDLFTIIIVFVFVISSIVAFFSFVSISKRNATSGGEITSNSNSDVDVDRSTTNDSPPSGDLSEQPTVDALDGPGESTTAENPKDAKQAGILEGPLQSASPSANERIVDPGNSDEVKAAVQKAFTEAKAVRWKANGDQGYAVPSEEANSVGCRSIYYTSEKLGADWRSQVQTVCAPK